MIISTHAVEELLNKYEADIGNTPMTASKRELKWDTVHEIRVRFRNLISTYTDNHKNERNLLRITEVTEKES